MSDDSFVGLLSAAAPGASARRERETEDERFETRRRGGFIQVSRRAEVGHGRSGAVNISFRRAVIDDADVLTA
jgi:hypothetical protein